MTRGMGNLSVSSSLVLVGLLAVAGCGGGTTNSNRNVSQGSLAAGGAANGTELFSLLYSPRPGLRLRRTSRLEVAAEGVRIAMESVTDDTLGPEPSDIARRCVRSSLTVGDEVVDVPCEGGGESRAREIVSHFSAIGAFAIVIYPDHPVRVGDAWACVGSPMEECSWTLMGIEAGNAIVALRAMTDFQGQRFPTEMIYTVRLSDGVPLSADLQSDVPGHFRLRGRWSSETFSN